MTRLLVAAAIAILALLPALTASAQQPEIEARVELDRAELTLGDRVRVAVIVLHPDNVLVDIEPPAPSGSMRVIDAPAAAQTPAAGGRSTTRFEFVLAAFALGEQQLAPLRLNWIEEDGASGEARVAVPPFAVRSTVAADDTVPRPLKPQLAVAGGPPSWRLPAAIGVGAVILAALGAFAVQRRLRPRATPVAVPAFAPFAEDEARRLLEELALAHPLAAGDYDTYYGTISMVIRGYLQARFGFGATALTTRELERRMTAEGVERWQARLVGGLLDRCDAAVYAGRRPDPASADHDLTAAFEIIELSRHAAERATRAEAGVSA